MRPRVTAILVAHSGDEILDRTLAALAAQTRAPDVTIAVDVTSSDATVAKLSASAPAQLLSVRDGTTFGAAVTHAVQFAPDAEPPNAEHNNEWLWLLGHDNAPEPGALAALLGAVEIAPSVAVAGPKLMRADEPSVISGFGETMSRFGTSVVLVEDELDQAQHDTRDDVLGVAAAGMLVRRSLWTTLGGFDPGLPSVDASLDFSVRARLAGHRVVLVPGARISSAGGPELFGRASVSDRRRFRLRRMALLHRRLVYSPTWAVAIHWLSLVPLAFVRSLVDLLAKHPSRIGGEFRAAFVAAFTGNVPAARRKLRSERVLGWGAIASLRIPPAALRERRAQAREAELAGPFDVEESYVRRAGFVSNGGMWAVLAVAIVGLLSYGAMIGANSVTGGGLLPVSGSLSALFANIGVGWREIGTGFFGAADPFAAVLAVLGLLTFWAPPFSIVLVYLCALPVAALGAWFASRRLSRSPWLPTLAAILWGVAPSLLSALAAGRLGAVLAHLLLPWLVLTALNARRSLASGAAAALLLAAVGASAPSLIPALAVLFVVLLVSQPTSIHRVVAIPIPMLALFAPLVVQQFLRGNLLGVLADPGVPLVDGATSGWRLALLDGAGNLNGWEGVLTSFGMPASLGPLLVAGMVAPVGVLAILALFVPGSRRAIPALVVALVGFLTAVAATHLQFAALGTQPVTVWPGAGLSLFWLGLSAAAIVGLDALGRATGTWAVLAGVATMVLALPLLAAMAIGTAAVQPTAGRILPALVTAEASTHPSAGTLTIASEGRAGIAVSLQRGAGATLDDQSTLNGQTTLHRTVSQADQLRTIGADQRRLATLAGNLASRSGYDVQKDLSDLDIRFVIVAPGSDQDDTYLRVVKSLASNELFTPVASTTDGLLWRYVGDTATVAGHPGNDDTVTGRFTLIGLALVFGITVLLAIPVGGRWRRPRAVSVLTKEDHG